MGKGIRVLHMILQSQRVASHTKASAHTKRASISNTEHSHKFSWNYVYGRYRSISHAENPRVISEVSKVSNRGPSMKLIASL